MSAFSYSIVTPDGDSIAGECMSIVVPTAWGPIAVLARHAPLLAEITFGALRIASGGKFPDLRGNEAHQRAAGKLF